MTEEQKKDIEEKRRRYDEHHKRTNKLPMGKIALLVIDNEPHKWFFTWELMGETPWGWLSHATHATLRVLQQQDKIKKDYVGKYVVYASKKYDE